MNSEEEERLSTIGAGKQGVLGFNGDRARQAG
jgi:hypothetical protein